MKSDVFVWEDSGVELFERTVVWNCLGGRCLGGRCLGGLWYKVRPVRLGRRWCRIVYLRGS